MERLWFWTNYCQSGILSGSPRGAFTVYLCTQGIVSHTSSPINPKQSSLGAMGVDSRWQYRLSELGHGLHRNPAPCGGGSRSPGHSKVQYNFQLHKRSQVALTWVARRTSAPNLHHNLYSPIFFCFVFVFNIYLAIASLRARGIFNYSMRFRPGALEAQSLNQGSPSYLLSANAESLSTGGNCPVHTLTWIIHKKVVTLQQIKAKYMLWNKLTLEPFKLSWKTPMILIYFPLNVLSSQGLQIITLTCEKHSMEIQTRILLVGVTRQSTSELLSMLIKMKILGPSLT